MYKPQTANVTITWSVPPEKRHGNLKYTEDIVDEWIKLADDGWTPKEIAEEYGFAVSTLVTDKIKRRLGLTTSS